MFRARPRSHRQSGFSLIETVAAVGILGVAAVPLMQIATGATRNTAHLENRMLARTVAENVLARAVADPEPVTDGQYAGQEVQLGRAYDWTLVSIPTGASLHRFEVSVTRAGDEQVVARLTTLKAEPLP